MNAEPQSPAAMLKAGHTMNFIFTCPKHHTVFECADFDIQENSGVVLDLHGNKILDARVTLKQPCPHCGERHVYHASELSCPFDGPESKNPATEGAVADAHKVRLTQTVSGSG